MKNGSPFGKECKKKKKRKKECNFNLNKRGLQPVSNPVKQVPLAPKFFRDIFFGKNCGVRAGFMQG